MIGPAAVDFLAVDLPTLPQGRGDEFNEETLVRLPQAPQITIGVNGGNAAFVLGRLGIRTRLVSPLGEGLLGQAVRGWLDEVGVAIDQVGPSLTSSNYVVKTVSGDRGSFFFSVEPDHAALIGLAKSSRLLPGDQGRRTR